MSLIVPSRNHSASVCLLSGWGSWLAWSHLRRFVCCCYDTIPFHLVAQCVIAEGSERKDPASASVQKNTSGRKLCCCGGSAAFTVTCTLFVFLCLLISHCVSSQWPLWCHTGWQAGFSWGEFSILIAAVIMTLGFVVFLTTALHVWVKTWYHYTGLEDT